MEVGSVQLAACAAATLHFCVLPAAIDVLIMGWVGGAGARRIRYCTVVIVIAVAARSDCPLCVEASATLAAVNSLQAP